MARKLNRLKDYNYSEAGAYFITICTKDKTHYFGEIANESMKLNSYGSIAYNSWQDIPNYYSNIELGEFIIMPNHIHGIIFLLEDTANIKPTTEQCSVPTEATSSHFGKVSKVVKSYKEVVTKQIKKDFNDTNFAWQRSFYDHVIRDEKGLDKIREYVHFNPLKWHLDTDIENLEYKP